MVLALSMEYVRLIRHDVLIGEKRRASAVWQRK
jgi:hypothetical protein